MAVPFALIVAITVVNLATPSHLHLRPLLVAAPALAAVILGHRLTTLTGVLALVGQVAIGVTLRDLSTTDRIAQMASVVLVSVFAVLLADLRERQVRELTQVRQASEIAQSLVLRPLPPRIGPLRVAAVYLAAEAEMQIGGDLYAAARTTSGTRLMSATSAAAASPPLVTPRCCWARSEGPRIGTSAWRMGVPCHQVDTFDFKAGDMLLLYTDGVIEARNSQGDFYPLAERAAAWAGKRPHVLLERLRTDLLAYAGGYLGDDAAMIAIERPGPVSDQQTTPVA
ncbi:SpoIIE family protein phosphatase [Microtetraspora malaysiensis]|uniref:SpoIIE family protein phosphatase n=1 Tax=Microtetraspora malaysiensis TaxID=161358 RepID=UPI003D9346EF